MDLKEKQKDNFNLKYGELASSPCKRKLSDGEILDGKKLIRLDTFSLNQSARAKTETHKQFHGFDKKLDQIKKILLEFKNQSIFSSDLVSNTSEIIELDEKPILKKSPDDFIQIEVNNLNQMFFR